MTPVSRNILVVDDEEPVRTLLRECFEMEGYGVEEAGDGASMEAALARQTFDLVTLDLNLGGENGLELARRIRSTCNIPIVMITGKGDTIDRVVGLELGADDYITKPFHLREVLARVRAVLRRYEATATSRPPTMGGSVEPTAGEAYVFGGWLLDVGRRELRSIRGQVQPLTTAEFDMLTMFVQRPNRVLSRDNIMDLLRGQDWSPMDRSIDSLVVRLRKKVEIDPTHPRLIKTVRGVGYVLAADVSKG